VLEELDQMNANKEALVSSASSENSASTFTSFASAGGKGVEPLQTNITKEQERLQMNAKAQEVLGGAASGGQGFGVGDEMKNVFREGAQEIGDAVKQALSGGGCCVCCANYVFDSNRFDIFKWKHSRKFSI
jgi:hypothetical protein